MNTQFSEPARQGESRVCHIEYLAEVSGLSTDEIEDLVTIGLITPADEAVQPPAFALCCVLTVKTARRLRDDFQLDRHGLALALTLVQRIRELQAELKALQARLG
jgi:chaperone modulatory protein CbpM